MNKIEYEKSVVKIISKFPSRLMILLGGFVFAGLMSIFLWYLCFLAFFLIIPLLLLAKEWIWLEKPINKLNQLEHLAYHNNDTKLCSDLSLVKSRWLWKIEAIKS